LNFFSWLQIEEGTSGSIPEELSSRSETDIPEEIIETNRSTEKGGYSKESFESLTEEQVPSEVKSASLSLRQTPMVKSVLSPRHGSRHRRLSSGSDESLNLSHTG